MLEKRTAITRGGFQNPSEIRWAAFGFRMKIVSYAIYKE